jgi:peptidoglycan/LPS O-acetylase OafA/YrhL
MKYRKEIDGLRSFAVIPVILFHAGLETFSGGFVGVDIFFVISGYLITTIILADLEKGCFSIVKFYERRARRILPALFLIIFISLPFSWLLLYPQQLKDFSQSIFAVSLFSSNFLFWLESGYFDTVSELKPLLHTWSLAVEEQYYILFPLFLILVWNIRKLWIFTAIIALAIFSLIIAEYWSIYKPDAAFFLLPSRAWELMIGALVAFLLLYSDYIPYFISKHKYTTQLLGITGFILIIFSVLIYNRSIPFPSIYALLPTVGTALIILFARTGTLIGTFLSNKIFVYIGLISYSAYLWHQPIIVFTKYYTNENLNLWIALAITISTFALAYLSWLFVEKPFRDRQKFSRKAIFMYSFTGSSILLVIGFTGHITSGFENQFIQYRLNADQQANYSLIKKAANTGHGIEMFDNRECMFWSSDINQKTIDRYIGCSQQHGKGVIILGDSHAMNLYNIIAKTDYHPFIMGISRGGCRPQDNNINCHYNKFDRFLSGFSDRVKYIVFHQSGSYFIQDENGHFDSAQTFKPDSSYDFSSEQINGLIEYLNKLSQFTRVYWMGPFVEARVELFTPEVINGNFRMNSNSLRIFRELEGFIIQKIVQSTVFKAEDYISFTDNIQFDASFLKVGECVTYRDIDHFSSCGEDILSHKIKPLLEDLDG